MERRIQELELDIKENEPLLYFSFVYDIIIKENDLEEWHLEKINMSNYLLHNYYNFIKNKLSAIKKATSEDTKIQLINNYFLKIENEYLGYLNKLENLGFIMQKQTGFKLSKISLLLLRVKLYRINLDIVKTDKDIIAETVKYIEKLEETFEEDILTSLWIIKLKTEELCIKCLDDHSNAVEILKEAILNYESKINDLKSSAEKNDLVKDCSSIFELLKELADLYN